MSENVALVDNFTPPLMFAYSRVSEFDGKTHIEIPEKFVTHFEENGISLTRNGVNVSDQGGYVVLWDVGDEELVEKENTYWIQITEEFDYILPFKNENRRSILLLGCGEILIFNHEHFWNRLVGKSE